MPGRALKLLESAASFSESGIVTMNSVQQAIERTMDVKVSVANTTEDRERLLHMEDLIHERMVNQVRATTDRKSGRVGKECRSRWSPYH